MFSLVKFDNNERQVVPTKRIKIGEDGKCTVNCKGTKFRAVVLKTHDVKEILEKKTTNAKKKKTNRSKIKLTHKLDIKKAQHGSDVVILSDIVVSETDSEKKNEESLNAIVLPADCEPIRDVEDLPIDQFIEKYDLNSNLKQMRAEICDGVPPVDPEIEAEIHTYGDGVPPVDPEMEAERHTYGDGVPPVDLEMEAEIHTYGDGVPPVDPEIEAEIHTYGDCVPPVDPEMEAEIHTYGDGVPPVDPEMEAEIHTYGDGVPPVDLEMEAEIHTYGDGVPPVDLEMEAEIHTYGDGVPPVDPEIEAEIHTYGDGVPPVDPEMEAEIHTYGDGVPPVDPEMEAEIHTYGDGVPPVDLEMEAEIHTYGDGVPPVDLEMEAEIHTYGDGVPPVNLEMEVAICNVTKYSTDENRSATLTNANDSTYVPDQSTVSYNNDVSRTSQKSEINNDGPPVDVRLITVPPSKKSGKRITKKYFCPFCKKLQSKFARHLELIHSSETEVQKFIKLPKGNSERIKIIETIRKNGNYIHNTQTEYNTGILITCRQQTKTQNSAEDYVCCKNCKGFFSKRTLRLHSSKCLQQDYTKGSKQMMVMGRKLTGYIHPRANITLRRKVFPVLRDDPITRLIKYDELIILFGNKLCDKYTLDHQHDMIRSNLRVLGRFLTAVKEREKDITDLSSVFQPKYFDSALESIRSCASYNPEKRMFEAPSVATTLGTLIKKCLKMYMSECIKKEKEISKKAAEDFLVLFEEEIPNTINRKVAEDQQKLKKDKKVMLPTKSDISCLYSFLKEKMSEARDALEQKFNLKSYNTLAESTLVLLQTFNRRRAGEIERLLISDYNNQETLDKNENSDLYNNISPESRNHAKKFIRITIRGKLGRIVPVLLDTFIVQCIQMILANRRKAGVSSKNEYVFAVPGSDINKKKYLRACTLMRKFSEECGAMNPSTLRGTTLRKHVATHTAMQGIEEREVTDLANFMGHHKDIHKNVYRVPVPIRDLTNVSKILENAMGNVLEDNEEPTTSAISATEKKSEDEPVETSQRRRRRFISGDSFSEDNEEPATNAKSATLTENKTKDKPVETTQRCRGRYTSGDSFSDSGSAGDSGELGKQKKSAITPRKRRRRVISSESDSLEQKDSDDHDKENDDLTCSEAESAHRRSTSPFGKTKRIRWNFEEKAAIADCFGDPTKCSNLPSLNQCFEASRKYKALIRRTPQQIKTWIDNQRKAKTRMQAYYYRKANKFQ